MPLSKVQLMNVPGGPGDFGAVQQGTGITINPDGSISSTPPTVTSIQGSNGVVVTPGPNPGEFELSFGGSLPTPLESGTTTYVFQAAAPTGWTKLTTQNDVGIRVTSGDGGQVGGADAFSTVFTLKTPAGTVSGSPSVSGTTNNSNWSPTGTLTAGNFSIQSTNLTIQTSGAHEHNFQCANDGGSGNMGFGLGIASRITKNTDGKGSNGAHNHSYNQSQNWVLDSKSHSHSFNSTGNLSGTLQGSNFTLNIKYIDAILVRRD